MAASLVGTTRRHTAPHGARAGRYSLGGAGPALLGSRRDGAAGAGEARAGASSLIRRRVPALGRPRPPPPGACAALPPPPPAGSGTAHPSSGKLYCCRSTSPCCPCRASRQITAMSVAAAACTRGAGAGREPCRGGGRPAGMPPAGMQTGAGRMAGCPCLQPATPCHTPSHSITTTTTTRSHTQTQAPAAPAHLRHRREASHRPDASLAQRQCRAPGRPGRVAMHAVHPAVPPAGGLYRSRRQAGRWAASAGADGHIARQRQLLPRHGGPPASHTSQPRTSVSGSGGGGGMARLSGLRSRLAASSARVPPSRREESTTRRSDTVRHRGKVGVTSTQAR